jgi:hypothetical protein
MDAIKDSILGIENHHFSLPSRKKKPDSFIRVPVSDRRAIHAPVIALSRRKHKPIFPSSGSLRNPDAMECG